MFGLNVVLVVVPDACWLDDCLRNIIGGQLAGLSLLELISQLLCFSFDFWSVFCLNLID